MLDNPVRVSWIDTLWKELKRELPEFASFPEDVCATVGYPPTKARGRKGERRGAYIGTEWKDSTDEKYFVSIHPENMRDGKTAGKALLGEMYRANYGTRRSKRYENKSNSNIAVNAVIERIGEPPSGYAQMTEPQVRGGSRLRKYECDCLTPIRAASDVLDVTCNTCGKKFNKV